MRQRVRNTYISQDWARPELGARNSIHVPHMDIRN